MAFHYYEYPDGQILRTDSPANWTRAKPLSRAIGAAKYQAYCASELRKLLKPGRRVYTSIKSVSSSGMSRSMSVLILERGGTKAGDKIRNISRLAAGAIGARLSKGGDVIMGGAGMDMGFALVYSIGRAIWPNGTSKPHGRRNGEPDSDGGYALNHEWI